MKGNLYVYFKADGDAEVAARVRALQADLAASTGVSGRLLRRRDNPDTWMEVYEDVGDFDRFEAALNAAAERHDVGAVLRPGERRHVERFVTV